MSARSIANAIADAIDRAIAETPINWRKTAINFVASPLVMLGCAAVMCALCNQWSVDLVTHALVSSAFLGCGFVAGAAFVISERER